MSLDIKDKQILVRYDDDDYFTWHHRVLLHRVAGSLWIVLTPDLSVQRLDLAAESILPLARADKIPARALNDCYLFDSLSAQELSTAKSQAKQLADILGEPEADDSDDVWVISDAQHARFGELVPEDILSSERRSSLRTNLGVVELEDGDPASEVPVARVARDELEDWRRAHAGGGDLRVLGTFRDMRGKRYLAFPTAVSRCVETKFADFPHPEPRATLEYLQGVCEAADGSCDSYHSMWCVQSSVPPNSAVAHDHKILLEALRLGVVYDQLNLANSAMAEQIARRLVQHEMACERDGRHPDYTGLGEILSGVVSDRGRLAMPLFTKWLADRQSTKAQTLKQARLLREEKRSLAKAAAKNQPGPKKKSKGGGKGDEA